jgi:hypothetical protein
LKTDIPDLTRLEPRGDAHPAFPFTIGSAISVEPRHAG